MRRAIALASAALIAAMASTACSGGSFGAKKTTENDGIVTIALATTDATKDTQFAKNWNFWATGGKGVTPGMTLMYETLLALDKAHPGKLLPALATSYEMADGGKKLVYHLREGVKWSDGTDFTSKDVKWTYDRAIGDACTDKVKGDDGKLGFKCWVATKVQTPDAHTAVIQFNEPDRQQVLNFALWYPIFPEHIWSKKNPDTDQNLDPVGTGPFKVKEFRPEVVKYELRDDYWGGKSKGVKEVDIIPGASVGARQAQLNRGEIDFTTGAAAGVLNDFVKPDPANNHYRFYPNGGANGVMFNHTVAPFNDVAVRQAMRAAIDPTTARDAAAVGYTIPTPAGLDPSLYADVLTPETSKPQAQDAAAAKKYLADAGWTIDAGGNLTKAGKSYPLTLFVNVSNNQDMQAGPIFVSQWKQVLGLNVKIETPADTVYNKSANQGRYPLFFGNVTGGSSLYFAYQGYSSGNTKPVGQDSPSVNFGRWQNKPVSDAAYGLQDVDPGDTDGTKPLASTIAAQAAKDAPFIATEGIGTQVMWSSRKWDGMPEVGKTAYVPGLDNYQDAIQTILNLSPSQPK
jgi:peptide/nickel transport system substrate-binding protein